MAEPAAISCARASVRGHHGFQLLLGAAAANARKGAMVARNFMVTVGVACLVFAVFERVSVLELELEDGRKLCHSGKVRVYVLYLNICRGFQLCCPVWPTTGSKKRFWDALHDVTRMTTSPTQVLMSLSRRLGRFFTVVV